MYWSVLLMNSKNVNAEHSFYTECLNSLIALTMIDWLKAFSDLSELSP